MNGTGDWFTVERIAEDVHRISAGEGELPCNAYLVSPDRTPLLIDTGLGIGDLPAMLASRWSVTPPVLLTHAHWDHLGAAHRFADVRVHPNERDADGSVSLDVFEERFDHRPGSFVEAWSAGGRSFPEAFDPDAYAIEPVNDAETVTGGDRVHVDDRTLDIVEIPGHSPGQIAAIDEATGICFAGDVLEPGGTIFAHFAGCDLVTYRRSLTHLIRRRDAGDFDRLALGHGPLVHETDVLDEARSAITRITEGEEEFRIVETPWGPSREYDLAGVTVLTVD